VDYFNPTSVLGIGARVDRGMLGQLYYQISEITGEAARLVKPESMGVNLLPPIIRARLAFQRQQPFLVLAALCLALAPLPMLYRLYMQKTTIVAESGQWKSRTSSLNGMARQVKDSANTATETALEISQYQSLYNSRFNWILFFSQLQNALVETQDVWLDSLSVDREIPTVVAARGGLTAPPPPVRPRPLQCAGQPPSRHRLQDRHQRPHVAPQRGFGLHEQ
jgi:hypothetical protein